MEEAVLKALAAMMNACEFTDWKLGSVHDESYRAFGFGPDSIVIRGRSNLNTFAASADSIHGLNREIADSFTKEDIVKRSIKTIRACHESGKQPDEVAANAFYQSLMQEPLREWFIARPIHGVSIGVVNQLELGPFTIIKTEELKELFKAQHPVTFASDAQMLEKIGTIFLLFRSKTRSGDRAKELADNRFEQFENIVAYMIAWRTKRYHVGVIHPKLWHLSQTFLFCSDGVSFHSDQTGPIEAVDLSAAYFNDKNNGNETIWKYLKLGKANDMQGRAILSAEWIGKGINDVDNAKAFMQFILAIESMLTVGTGVISPSIMSQVAETAAMLLGKDYDNSCDIERLTKKLYGVRSAIVHSGKNSVLENDLGDALGLAVSLVRAFLVDPRLLAIQSSQELITLLKRHKYRALA